jgi:polysaccharide deacetylase family protein (PEP-CTERM system associated)
MKNYLTIDVEDYFQVSAFEDIVGKDKWSGFDSRVTKNTFLILDILAEYNIQATFFVVGWVAEKYPEIVSRIKNEGHEVGCHSYWHRKVYDLSPEEFREDTKRAKDILEDIIGQRVVGYRAPSYSITQKSLWALDILSELGFEYDSSIFPVLHDNYGIPDAPRFKYLIQANNLVEYPISTAKLFGGNIPVSGGGYFRLFPYWFTRMLLKRINLQENQKFIFYLHPWEIDPDQPRMKSAKLLSKFRHYNNLQKTSLRLKLLLTDFNFGPIRDTLPLV